MAVRVRESRILNLMKQEGIKTQTELAERLSIGIVSLNRVIKGRRPPGSGMIDKFCVALNCQPGDFLYFEPDE